ncbi:M28 family peptidase [Clostridium lundense]|uniref:M28 family peptidase n=1 Tax=Clostridium lundense TaxID=319475 RepID=UPI000A848CB9|nr:M28 family peptidase [Clostridium lundense]
MCAIFTIAITLSSCSFNINGCKSTKSNNEAVNNNQSSESTQVQIPVKIPATKEIVTTLCSDEFEGRLIGSKGNEKAGEYIAGVFKNIGLDTLFEDSYYQKYYQGVSNTLGNYGNNTKLKMVNNVVGIIKGKEGKERRKAVVISAHFDHEGYQDGKIIRGALDNASGVSALIQIAHTLKERSKEKSFDTDIIIAAFNGEETNLSGSKAFIGAILAYMYDNYNLYNINIDCIGSKNGGKLALKNKSSVSNKLYDAVKTTMKKNNIEFADTTVRGTSDHKSFENVDIPNVFIVQENINKLVHNPTDTPDSLDYEQIDKIANAISDFVETNNGIMFEAK